MSQEYVLWTAKIEPNAASLSELDGFETVFALKNGIRQRDDWPDDVTMQMDARKPTDTLLTDNMKNLHGVIVVSAKLKAFLEDRAIKDIEILPITVLDHKGRPADADYFIMNPVDNPDCLDLDACAPEWSAIDDTVIQKVAKLAIKPDWDPADKPIFRPKFYRARPFVTKALAAEIDEENFTGLRWQPISEVKGRLK